MTDEPRAHLRPHRRAAACLPGPTSCATAAAAACDRIDSAGAARRDPAPGVLAALRGADAIVIPPSTRSSQHRPDPGAPRRPPGAPARGRAGVAVSPLVGGRPVKGPLHRMLRGLGHEVSPRGVAPLLRGRVDAFVLDAADRAFVAKLEALGIASSCHRHDHALARTLRRGRARGPARSAHRCASSAICDLTWRSSSADPRSAAGPPGRRSRRPCSRARSTTPGSASSRRRPRRLPEGRLEGRGRVVGARRHHAVAARAQLAAQTPGQGPALVEVVLRESDAHRAHRSRPPDRRDRPGLGVRERGHRPVERGRRRTGHAAAARPRRLGAATARSLRGHLGVDLAVVVTDTFGRPWREGLVEVALGVAGMAPVDDLRGTHDMNGHELGVTVIGVADEIACAAGLAMRKAAGIAAVLVRGCEVAPEPAATEQRGGRSMIRPREHDLFR